jgi:hypothetical protein
MATQAEDFVRSGVISLESDMLARNRADFYSIQMAVAYTVTASAALLVMPRRCAT